MAMFISQDGGKTTRVDESVIPKESALQKYIQENPQAIPFYEIEEGTKVEVLATESPTDSGPIDALGLDQAGNIYIIETKLSKNSDKRAIVAQALDYGASLRFHQTANNFLLKVEELFSKSGTMLQEHLKQTFELDEDGVNVLLNLMRDNFKSGKFRFVIVMDKLNDKLRDLIRFVNERSEFSIFGVEMKYYKHEHYEVVVPTLFGSEKPSEKPKEVVALVNTVILRVPNELLRVVDAVVGARKVRTPRHT